MEHPSLFDPPAARTSDPVTSHKSASHLGMRRASQQGQLLEAYAKASAPLSDEQVAELAGFLNTRACWWKRCSELRAKGLVEVVGTTISAAGEEVQTCLITDDGWAIFGKWRMDEARNIGGK